MAGAGLFQMAPYQWTDTAGLSMEGLKLAGQMAASMDKKVKQTTTTKTKSGGSGLGNGLGSAVGGIAGSFFGPMGTMVGSALGGAIGGAIDGGSSGAAAGAAGGLGMGAGMASSDSFMGATGSLWDNLGFSGQKAAASSERAGSAGSSYKGLSVGDTYKLNWSGLGGMFKWPRC